MVKYLIENYDLSREAIHFDEWHAIRRLEAPKEILQRAIYSGQPFMTNGCPDRDGNLACNRPYGSYRPGEEYRDYPFVPNDDDLIIINDQLRLAEIWSSIAGVVV